MKRVLFIIAPSNFNDDELEKPKEILEDAGLVCDVASTVITPVKGMHGLLLKPDLNVDSVIVANYECIIIVGGSGSSVLSTNKKVMEILQNAAKDGKIIGAICLGGVMPALAGVLKGKKATVWKHPESLKVYKENGVEFVDAAVVVDGKIVTGQGPSAAVEFGKKLLELLLSSR